MSASPEPAPEPLPDPDHPDRPRGSARTLLTVAGVVVSAEALALLALAAAELQSVDSSRVGLGVSTAVFFGGFGVVLLFAVSRILAGHAWARGLLVFSQLLCLLLAFNVRDEAWWMPVTLAGAGLVSLVCLLSPPVTRALARDAGAV